MQTFANYGWLVVLWILASSFQYGYHISALNQIQRAISCPTQPVGPATLPECIPMTDMQFSIVTSTFTVGGLLGSIMAKSLMEKYGRRAATKATSVFFMAGTAFMTAASSTTALLIGRFLIGIGAGIGICVTPVYIAEVTPDSIKGGVGVLTQLSVVFGILFTQAIGMYLAVPTAWRLVFLLSFVVSLLQFLFAPAITESPAWLDGNNRAIEASNATSRLWRDGSKIPSTSEAEAALLPPTERSRDQQKALTLNQLLQSRELKKPVWIVTFIMLAQQFSGINAVLYYSNNILAKTLPDFASNVSLGITVVNALMTFPSIYLIESMGRKSLLKLSVVGALATLLAVGYGINSGQSVLSGIAIVAFVSSFAVGLGPVPFVLISEIVPYEAVSALSSLALSVNWVANFIVGIIFMPLRDILSSGDPSKEGRVFYVFATALVLFYLGFHRIYDN